VEVGGGKEVFFPWKQSLPLDGKGVDKKTSLLYLHRNNDFSIHSCGEIKESMLTFEGGGK